MTDVDSLITELQKLVLGIFVHEVFQQSEQKQSEEAKYILRLNSAIKDTILNSV